VRLFPTEEAEMPTWAWILIIVLLVLLVFGGVGYGRR
jgi:flagellar basal body-associated protein FliL